MKVEIQANVLKEGLKKVGEIINWKNSIPILQGIYMNCNEQGIELRAGDQANIICHWIPVDGQNVDVVEPGAVMIPEQAYKLLMKLKSSITLEVSDSKLYIRYGKKSELSVPTMNTDEYPRLPKVDTTEATLTLEGQDFSNLVQKTVISASKSEARPILQGVNVRVTPDKITWIATDSHRLGQVVIKKGNEENGNDIQMVVPAETLKKVLKSFDLNEPVNVYCQADNLIVLKNGFSLFFIRLLEGKYPETERLIPDDFTTEIKISREHLLSAIDRLKPIVDSGDTKKGILKMSLQKDVVVLSTAQSEVGQCVETLDHEVLKGEELEIFFSLEYFKDALSTMDSSDVWIKFTGKLRPFMIAPNSSNYEELQLLLPIRMM